MDVYVWQVTKEGGGEERAPQCLALVLPPPSVRVRVRVRVFSSWRSERPCFRFARCLCVLFTGPYIPSAAIYTETDLRALTFQGLLLRTGVL